MRLSPPNDSCRTVMNRIEHRRFHWLFLALAVLLGLPFASPLLTAEENFPIGLAQGTMAGEVGTDSAILQSRLTSTSTLVDRRWSGIIGVEGFARFEISTHPDFSDPVQTEWHKSLPENDYIVKLKVSDLRPDTRYHYRLSYGPKQDQLRQSTPGSFRTLAGKNGRGPFSIAVVTGMNYTAFHHTGNGQMLPYRGPDKELGYPALASILALKPDFFVGTGDNVYYDFPGGGFGHLQRGRAETQHQMRMKHQEQYSQRRFLDLFRSVGTYWMKDDHDHRFNDSDPFNPTLVYERTGAETYAKTNLYSRFSGSGSAPSHELGLRIFREQLPVVDPRDPGAVTYRTHRVSRDLQIWIVEGRDYRSPNDMPDGPEKTIWGKEQRNWLKQTLLESDAAFKLLISPTPMVGPDSSAKRDNHVNPKGFRHEGDAFFKWLQNNAFSTERFFVVCGDRHWQYRAIHPSGFQEFSCGALVDANSTRGHFPGEPRSSDPQSRVRQPFHSEEPSGGFLLVKVSEARAGLARVEFVFHDERGRGVYEYRVEAPARLALAP